MEKLRFDSVRGPGNKVRWTKVNVPVWKSMNLRDSEELGQKFHTVLVFQKWELGGKPAEAQFDKVISRMGIGCYLDCATFPLDTRNPVKNRTVLIYIFQKNFLEIFRNWEFGLISGSALFYSGNDGVHEAEKANVRVRSKYCAHRS